MGVRFDVHNAHEQAHVAPLQRRLADIEGPGVTVMPGLRKPERGETTVQVFHGLGDKNYNGNAIFLQKGRFPRVRTALNRVMRMARLPAPFLRAPARPGRRDSRYDVVNAFGPRSKDMYEDMLSGCEITKFGHIALNDIQSIRYDPDGPLVWLPTWDNRPFMGGQPLSSLAPFAHEVALLSRKVPVRVKYHPLTHKYSQDRTARVELARAPNVEVVNPAHDPYPILDGVRGLLTDTSSLGFEAYCMGIPVGLALPHGRKYEGLHAELALRVPVLHSGKPDLADWALQPPRGQDADFVRDLLYVPTPKRNDAFADYLRQRSQG